MVPFTYADHPRNVSVVWLCVLASHAAVLYALSISAPQMDNKEKSLAMEMVLAPVRDTPTAKALAQPVMPSKASVATPEKATPSTTAPTAPTAQTHTTSTSNDVATTAAPTTSTTRAQAAPALTLPSSEAQGLNNPKPGYPKFSRRLNEQGQVVIRVYVGTDGNAQQGEIKSSSGYDRLDQEALRTVLRWRFVPGQRLGTPEAMWFNVPVNFVLE